MIKGSTPMDKFDEAIEQMSTLSEAEGGEGLLGNCTV